MIQKKIGEMNIEFPILTILSNNPNGLDTSKLKQLFKNFTNPAGINLKPLLNRNDTAIDQIVRNIVSHRYDSKNNMINRGLIDYSNGILIITEAGKEYLQELSKQLFNQSME